jgi:hypothetical protein
MTTDMSFHDGQELAGRNVEADVVDGLDHGRFQQVLDRQVLDLQQWAVPGLRAGQPPGIVS